MTKFEDIGVDLNKVCTRNKFLLNTQQEGKKTSRRATEMSGMAVRGSPKMGRTKLPATQASAPHPNSYK